MEPQPLEDFTLKELYENVTINLNPDTPFKSFISIDVEPGQNKSNGNENNIRPEAARAGGRGGQRSGKGGGRKGDRKRHPNFAARNRKIGKGGPTGRGGLRGLRRRRPTVPVPPDDDSDGEPLDNKQEVDMRTSRIKRKPSRPKSAQAQEKEKKKREEFEIRKAGKKKRPGPKQKDRKDMRDKIKRFWREAPIPKDKKAPKFVLDGLQSEKEEKKGRSKGKGKGEPEDFDDLRMPSKRQLKKKAKEDRKYRMRKEKKQKRKLERERLQGAEKGERIVEGEYVPTLSEIEGIEGDIGSYIRECQMNEARGITDKPSTKLRLKLKPKNIDQPESKVKDFQEKSLSEIERDHESFVARNEKQNNEQDQRNWNSKSYFTEHNAEGEEETPSVVSENENFRSDSPYEKRNKRKPAKKFTQKQKTNNITQLNDQTSESQDEGLSGFETEFKSFFAQQGKTNFNENDEEESEDDDSLGDFQQYAEDQEDTSELSEQHSHDSHKKGSTGKGSKKQRLKSKQKQRDQFESKIEESQEDGPSDTEREYQSFLRKHEKNDNDEEDEEDEEESEDDDSLGGFPKYVEAEEDPLELYEEDVGLNGAQEKDFNEKNNSAGIDKVGYDVSTSKDDIIEFFKSIENNCDNDISETEVKLKDFQGKDTSGLEKSTDLYFKQQKELGTKSENIEGLGNEMNLSNDDQKHGYNHEKETSKLSSSHATEDVQGGEHEKGSITNSGTRTKEKLEVTQKKSDVNVENKYLNSLDDVIYKPQDTNNFDKHYEAIKKYFESENIEKDEEINTILPDENEGEDESYKSASSDDYEVWDSVQERFRKPRKKKKMPREASFELKGSETRNEKKKGPVAADQSLSKKFKDMRIATANKGDLSNMPADESNSWLNDERDEDSMSTQEKKLKLPISTSPEKKKPSKIKEEKTKHNNTVKKRNDQSLPKTGTVLDEKMETIIKDMKSMENVPYKEKMEMIDDIGQLLYNDADDLLNEDGGSVRGYNESDVDMRDYENYVKEIYDDALPKGTFEGKPVQLDARSSSKESDKKIENIEESTDSDEGEESSYSYKEELDVALMAGLRSDRIRVFDRNVSLYADQDHQAKILKYSSQLTPSTRSLSDEEYEIAMKSGELVSKPHDDDVLLSTEVGEPTYKESELEQKKSQGKKHISSDSNDIKSGEKKDDKDIDYELIDKTKSSDTPEDKIETEQPNEYMSSTITPIKKPDLQSIEPSKEDISLDKSKVNVETPEIDQNLGDKKIEATRMSEHETSLKEEVQSTTVDISNITSDPKSNEEVALNGLETEQTLDVKGYSETTKIETKDTTTPTTTFEAEPQRTTAPVMTDDIDILGEEDNEEEEEVKTNEALKENWRSFVNTTRQCFEDFEVDFPEELPDDDPSEEEAPPYRFVLPGRSKEAEHDEVSIRLSKYESKRKAEADKDKPIVEEDSVQSQSVIEVQQDSEKVDLTQPEAQDSSKSKTGTLEESMDNVPDIEDKGIEVRSKDGSHPKTEVTPLQFIKNGINEFLEEDRWELWYKMIAIMNNNKTRSYDNVAALFKAKRQEILTRTKAPIPPWEEPGISEYESKRRKVQREWEKTERYYALKGQEGINEYLTKHYEKPSLAEQEEGFRAIFRLMEADDYDHQAYKDSLSREELAEIYSEDEVEEEIQNRELRKQGKDLESLYNKARADLDPTVTNVPDIDHPVNTLEEMLSQPDTEMCNYDTEPEFIKNDPTNPINYKVYSDKFKEEYLFSDQVGSKQPATTNEINHSDSNPSKTSIEEVDDIGLSQQPVVTEEMSPLNTNPLKSSIEDVNETARIENETQINKREQAKKMWQYFLQLMRERHEKNIEQFLSLHSLTKRGPVEDSRRLWQLYSAFASGQPMSSTIPEDGRATGDEEEETQRVGRFSDNQQNRPQPQGYPEYENQAQSLRDGGSNAAETIPSAGWNKLMDRIQNMKFGPNAPLEAPASLNTAPLKRPQENYGYKRVEPLPHVAPPPPQYDPYRSPPPPPVYAVPGPSLHQQQPRYYADPRAYPPTYAEPPKGFPPRADPYYAHPMYSYSYDPPASHPQARGLQGVSEYHSQITNPQGDVLDPYGRPVPPNVSLNRTYNTPEMGYQNPDFTRAMNDRATYMANQADPYTANRSRVGWPGDHSDKFHNRKYFQSDIGGQQTYIPRDLSGYPGDDSNANLNRSNFRNPNFGFRSDTYSRQPFAKPPPEYPARSIRGWQSGTRPLATSGLKAGPTVPPSNPQEKDSYVPQGQGHIDYAPPVMDSTWPPQDEQHASSNQQTLEGAASTDNNFQPSEE